MKSSSNPAYAESKNRTISARITGWHWKWPILLASALWLVLTSVAISIHSLSGEGPILANGQGKIGLDVHLRTDFILALVSAFTFGSCLATLGKATREFDRLRPILRLDTSRFDDYRFRLVPNARALFIAAVIGGSTGASLNLMPWIFSSAIRQSHPSLHSFPMMILLFGLLGMLALITHRQSQVFDEVGRRHVDLDLLDPEALSPFSAVGLMHAGLWLVGSAISSLLASSTANVWVVLGVILVTTCFGAVGLIAPSRGLHEHIRTRKREELARIRDVIASERAVLFSADERSPVPPKMHAMLAYEARILAVRDWPFDTSTLSRFALFLLIPLVSWIGGALVERAVNAALG